MTNPKALSISSKHLYLITCNSNVKSDNIKKMAAK